MPDLVNLTIDDKQITVPAGMLVVDAARTAGIEIPVFCSHPKLDPLGACRMCLVEFAGPRGSRLDTSCTVRVSEGMIVRTDTPQVKAIREANLAFILINHPLDCPICDKGGECPLQDQTMAYGPGASRFVEPKRRKQKHYPISDLIMLDQERCILCWRCIRYLEEWEDKPQLGLFERGGETLIDVFPGKPVDAKTSGNIIDICPVGALTNRIARFRYRPWELRKTPSICTLCPVGCNVRLDERVHELRRIVARENPAVNDEWICDKGRFVHQYVDHPDRLTVPLVRDGGAGGELRPASWDEALARVVQGMADVIAANGPEAVGGIAGEGVSNEAAYLFQKLFRTMPGGGSNNVDHRYGSAVRANRTGLSAISDIGRSDLIVLVGLDPSECAPLLDLHIKRALLRSGSRIVVINPRRIELARYANDSRIKPGAFLPAPNPEGEAAVLGALHAILKEGAASESVGARAIGRTPRQDLHRSQGAPVSLPSVFQGGVPAASLKAAAALLQGAKSPLFLYGPGAAMGERGFATVATLNALATRLGHGNKVAYIGQGGNSQGLRDMGLLPDALPGHQPVGEAAVRDRLGKLWGVPPPTAVGSTYAQMLAAGPGSVGAVDALYIMGANPAAASQIHNRRGDPPVVAPGTSAEGLRRLKFLVVQDLFLTETASLAHVVLPSLSFAESDATYTNLERRVQRAPACLRAAGESRADWAIIAALATLWRAREIEEEAYPPGAVQTWKKKPARARPGGGPKAWNYPSAQAVLEEIGKAVPFYADLQWGALGERGVQWPTSAVATAARAALPAIGSGSAAIEDAERGPKMEAPAAGSYWLVASSILWDGGLLTEPQLVPDEGFVSLNPGDLAASGLAEGATVVASSQRGSVRVKLHADASVQAGSAWIPLNLPGRPAENLGGGLGEPIAIWLARLGAPA